MKNKRITLSVLALSLSMISPMSASAFSVQTTPITLPTNVPNSEAISTFPNGFSYALGSGLAFKGYTNDGDALFVGITDRGPNGDAPLFKTLTGLYPAKFFLSPSFTPTIVQFKVSKNGKVTVLKTLPITNQDGSLTSGLPIPSGKVGSTNEYPLTTKMAILPFDVNGLDTEGITIDNDGNYWLCDEYGPFLIKVNAKGQIVQKFSPENGLPEILQFRQANRGFEGVSVTPSGKIVAIVQSTLDVDGATGTSEKTALFTRIVEFDPLTKKTKMYAYPINKADYKSQKDAKLGDIYALSDTKFLIIEQGKDINKVLQNKIYEVDTSLATDISNVLYQGKALETATDSTQISNVIFATKKLHTDLRTLGYTYEKAEGLTVLNKNRIAVINDNDFGLSTVIKGPSEDITEYTFDAVNKAFLLKEKQVPATIEFRENNEVSTLWEIPTQTPLLLTPPTLRGVSNEEITNQNVTLHWNIGNATLNNKKIKNGLIITKPGTYSATVQTLYGEQTRVTFTIDKQSPRIIAKQKGTSLQGTLSEAATLQLQEKNGVVVSQKNIAGQYQFNFSIAGYKKGTHLRLLATDSAGNQSIKSIIVH
ncbi:MAG: esterase-like activity of phytase family protein [Bacilli bacterium]